jgi:hypothetical protein
VCFDPVALAQANLQDANVSVSGGGGGGAVLLDLGHSVRATLQCSGQQSFVSVLGLEPLLNRSADVAPAQTLLAKGARALQVTQCTV